MAHEFIELGGGRHASVGKDFKQKIQELVRTFSKSAPGLNQQDIENELCNHPYLSWDEWGSAIHQASLERYRRCLKLFNEFSANLGTVSQIGLDDTTGQAGLTPDKLRGRPIRLLDVAADSLLIEVERHPTGGSGKLLIQYWLYKSSAGSIELLRPIENIVNIRFDNPLRQDQSGVWCSASEERDSFLHLVQKRLGDEAMNRLKQLTNFQLVLLSAPPVEILEQCNTRTGQDYIAEEKQRSEEAAARYTKKFGPRTAQPTRVSLNITQGATLHVLEANHFLKQLQREISTYLVANYQSLGYAEPSDITVELKLKESPQCFEMSSSDSASRIRISLVGYAMTISDLVNPTESATLDVARRGTSEDFDLIIILGDNQRCKVSEFTKKMIAKLRSAAGTV